MRQGLFALVPLALGCGAVAAAPPPPMPFPASTGTVLVETVAEGLEHPWAIAFLPDGRMLVTERPGRMRLATAEGGLSEPLANVPAVFVADQAGLLDLVVDRDHARNSLIYFCFIPQSDGAAHVARARLVAAAPPRLEEVITIFRQEGPPAPNGVNVVCRLHQAPDGTLFVSLGDHFEPRDEAQNLANHLGKVVRIAPDGAIPADNPFVGRFGTKPEIWSYGHRNISGLAINPADGRLWAAEHGPLGGDELNIIVRGANYGWPEVTHGRDYDGAKIGRSSRQEGMEPPAFHWTPALAPSGLTFYSGALWPEWEGSLFMGALAGQMLLRLQVEGDRIRGEERLLIGLGERIRDVREGPDGALWLLTDSPEGRILRLRPWQVLAHQEAEGESGAKPQ